ncbi:MAG: MFS transporter [Caldilineales bacterium]|nr:MFS transporter [Caldilineales bacterium]
MSTSIAAASTAKPAETVEQPLRNNFLYLYGDIAGFGIASGTTLAFLAIYLTRIGASTTAVSLLTAGPALVNLFVTLPAGQWIASRRLNRLVFRSAMLSRVIYPLLIPLVLWVSPAVQTQAILLLVMLTAIPGAFLAIGFNALLAEIVPEKWRGHVMGRRNAILALTMLAGSLLAGQILTRMPLQQGYVIVFALGAIGAAISTYFLALIKLRDDHQMRVFQGAPLADAGRATRLYLLPDMPLQRTFAIRMLTRVQARNMRTMLAPLRTSFAPFVAALFFFHFAQFMPIPLFPLYWVRELGLDDQAISIVNLTFYMVMFLASLRLGQLTARFGNRRLLVATAFMITAYPLLTALSRDIRLVLVASVIGGIATAIMGGALGNRLLERVPSGDRPRHLALYNLSLNLAVLGGALTGAFIAEAMGLHEALFLAFGMRALAGVVLLARA